MLTGSTYLNRMTPDWPSAHQAPERSEPPSVKPSYRAKKKPQASFDSTPHHLPIPGSSSIVFSSAGSSSSSAAPPPRLKMHKRRLFDDRPTGAGHKEIETSALGLRALNMCERNGPSPSAPHQPPDPNEPGYKRNKTH